MKTHFFNLPLRFASALCLLLLAAGHPAFGAVTFTGDTSNDGTTVIVGDTGEGSLLIDGGSSLSTEDGYVGYQAGGVGNVTVSSGSLTTSWLFVGTGTLNLSGTGNIISNNACWLNSGTVNVSGGSLTTGMFIAELGTGTLNLTGGNVTVTGSSGWGRSGTLGTANVSGGTWATNLDLSIGGEGGTGVLNLSGSGLVTNQDGYLGGYSDPEFFGPSIGTANISGGTWINSGNLTVGVDGTGTLNINGGTVIVGANLTKGGNGSIQLNAGGTLQIGSGGTSGTLSVNDLTNNGTLAFKRSYSSTYSGIISGTGTVTKLGAGTLTLNGSNTYTGATAISAGTLQIGANGTTGSLASNITNSAALVFNRSDNSTYSGTISGTGAVTKSGAGTLTLNGSNTYSGATTISAGTLQIGANGTTGSLTSNITNNAALVFNRSNASSYSGIISGTGAVTKSGSGTLTLTGTNTYTGNTTVSAGTLNVNGSTSASSRFTVASGATLGGNGTIGGATMIYGIHSPGNSPGIQTFTGNLTYDTSGGSIPTVNWQLSGNTDTDFSAFDQIVVGGNLAFNTPTSLVLDFSGYGDVDWSDTFWTTDQSWVIYDVAGTTTGANNFSIATANWADNSGDSFNNALAGSSFALALQGNDLVLNYTAGTSAVPEPSQVAASLLLLSGLGIYLWRRKTRLA